jgi:hypothetical protein
LDEGVKIVSVLTSPALGYRDAYSQDVDAGDIPEQAADPQTGRGNSFDHGSPQNGRN